MSNVQINLQQAAERLLQADDILILSHRRPDGDTIGTAFGLHYALKELGKRSRVECADDFPKKFSYFYANYEPENFEPQFVVAVDVASVSLLGKLAHVYGESVDLVIDHHKSNEFYGKETLLDVAAPATTEIMYLMLEYLGVSLNKDIANALFTGLITDTGGFRFPTVTARTFRVAADLLDGGAEHGKINRVIFESTSRGRLAVEALAINTLKYYLDNRCAVLYLPGDVKEMYCIDEEELDGISSLPRTIDGIDVGVTIRDLGKNTYRISLRTESPYDASEICAQFGGGGHLNAAGCTMEGELADVEAKLVQAVERETGIGERMRNGILLVDKPVDFTSHDVVAKMRGILRMKKIGHAGTLDPMATGVLPLFLGPSTRACDRLPDQNKTYLATLKLGITTDTQDVTGTILETRPVNVKTADVEKALLEFQGEIKQVPPMYSAVQINGKRLYDLARQGKEIERPARDITIYSIELLDGDEENCEYHILVSCSKGTYIRTLCHDIGEKLGCGGTLANLRRTEASGFSIDDCLTLEQIETFVKNETIDEYILSADFAFRNYEKVVLDEVKSKQYLNGVPLWLNQLNLVPNNQWLRLYGPDEIFLGIGKANVEKRQLSDQKQFAGEVSY